MALNFPASPTTGDFYTAGGSTWQWDGTAWNIVSSSTPINIPNVFNNVTVRGEDSTELGTITADATNDTLTLVAGSNITMNPDPDTDSITISSNEQTLQNVLQTVDGDTGSFTAQTPGDSFYIAGGNAISTTVLEDTVTIDFTGTIAGVPEDFTDLNDVTTSGLTVDQFYLPAFTKLVVDNNAATSYTFDQYGAGGNPTIYVISGTTIAFDLSNIEGHPFLIQDATGTNYNTGLVHVTPTGTVTTGADAQGKTSGTLYWKVPFAVSGGYRYQCDSHAAMVGSIQVKSFVGI
jgi:plastocyanin